MLDAVHMLLIYNIIKKIHQHLFFYILPSTPLPATYKLYFYHYYIFIIDCIRHNLNIIS